MFQDLVGLGFYMVEVNVITTTGDTVLLERDVNSLGELY